MNMNSPIVDRRQFLATAAAVSAAMMLPPARAHAAFTRSKIRKAKIIGKVTEEALAPLKAAGFDGVETSHITPDEQEAQAGRAAADKIGMRIHSVLRGWMQFSSENATTIENSLDQVRLALHNAKIYGADAILVVPCKVDAKTTPMPTPGQFDIAFDEKTGHVTRVVKGDNAPFAEYIKAQNHATDSSRKAVEKLIPLAQELNVKIGLENVWNNLWVDPHLYRWFIASFNHPYVQAYYDIGNHVKYSKPELWVKTLGKLICKLHIKDFKLEADGHSGKFVHPREGSIDWPAVRAALEEAGYDGWATIEDGGLPLEEFNRRFDLIIAGK